MLNHRRSLTNNGGRKTPGQGSRSKPVKRNRFGRGLLFQPREPSQHEKLLARCSEYLEVHCREVLAVGSGFRTEQRTEDLFLTYSNLFSPRNVRHAREAADAFSGMPSKKFPERFDRLAWFLLEGLVSRKLAAHDDRIATAVCQAAINLDGKKLPCASLTVRLSQERDPAKREKLWSAYVALVEEVLNPLLIERNKYFHKTLRRAGYETEALFCQGRQQVDYGRLLEALNPVAAATDAVYADATAKLIRRRLQLRFPGLSRAHEAYLLSLREFDRSFPAGQLRTVCQETCCGLGLDLGQTSSIRVDTEDRPTKDPVAFCVSIDPPREIHLVTRPRGGAEDYASFLHEAGHAWFYACMSPKLPFEFRCLERSLALSETYAFLLEGLLQNEGWLTAVLGLDDATASEVARRQKLADLYLLRRFIGKLEYELEFRKSPLDNWRNRFNYHHILSRRTGVDYDDALYLLDMDRGFYTADYLRAWLAEAQMREHLETRFGRTWFRTPAAGQFLRELWSQGESWECEEMVSDALRCRAWDSAPLLRRFTGLGG